ncbi:MAG: tetratricopeptide repeat protein [Cardiobacteriaceae bacterium]|nr:tetratricopeptide repeat protein [Cardiobacteriaceae bacterium]
MKKLCCVMLLCWESMALAQNDPPVALLPVQPDTLTPEKAQARAHLRAAPAAKAETGSMIISDDGTPLMVEKLSPPPAGEGKPPVADNNADKDKAATEKSGEKDKKNRKGKKSKDPKGQESKKAHGDTAAKETKPADGKDNQAEVAQTEDSKKTAANAESTGTDSESDTATPTAVMNHSTAALSAVPPTTAAGAAASVPTDVLPPAPAEAVATLATTTVPAKTAAEEESDPAWGGYAQAQSMAENGNPQGALRQLNIRLAARPDDGRAAYLKGLVLMQLGKGEEAERWYKMMQVNFPELPQSGNALAVIYAGRGDLPAAESALRDLLQKHPEHVSARVNLARLYVQMAQAEYEKALKGDPDNAMIARKLEALKAMQ